MAPHIRRAFSRKPSQPGSKEVTVHVASRGPARMLIDRCRALTVGPGSNRSAIVASILVSTFPFCCLPGAEPFRPSPLLRNGHLASIVASTFRADPHLDYEREIMTARMLITSSRQVSNV